MLEIFSRVKMKPKQVIAVALFVMIASVAQMLISTLVSTMINDGVGGNNTTLLITMALVMVGLALLACVLCIVGARISASITTTFTADLRREIFHKVESFSAAEIDKFGTSSLITRNTTDMTQIQTFLSTAFRMGLMAPMTMIAGVILCITTAGKVSVVLVVAIPVLILGVALLTFAASRHPVKLRTKIDDINQLFLEALEGARDPGLQPAGARDRPLQ